MSASADDLLVAYARLGVEHCSDESTRVKERARLIGVAIATTSEEAIRAVASPFRPPCAGKGMPMMLIPMPCKQKRVFASFFAPWLGQPDAQELSFDLVVLTQQGPPFPFRFEPKSLDNKSAHG